MSTGSRLFNFIRQNASDHFREVVPEATESNITDLSNILFGQEYAPTLNEFIDTMVNRIGMVIVRDRAFNNPLKPFKKGSVPLGSDVEEIATNLLDAEQYTISDAEAAKINKVTLPDTKVAYIKRNRKDRYTLSIAYDSLHAAFVSWDKFGSYVDSLFTALYNSAETDEFEKMKELIAAAYANNKVVIKTVSAVTDQSTAEALVMTARADFIKMKYPSTKYNPWAKNTNDSHPLKTFTPANRMVLFVTADVAAKMDVKVLAKAFNMENADFLGRVIEVDQIDADGKIQAILCDESFLQVYDNLYRMEEFNNGRILVRNYYLHVWQIMGVSMLSNAIIYATEAPTVNATDIEFTADTISLEQGGSGAIEVVSTPITATSAVTYAVTTSIVGGDPTDITVTPNSSNSKIANVAVAADAAAGNYTITATSNTHTDTITLTVTASS